MFKVFSKRYLYFVLALSVFFITPTLAAESIKVDDYQDFTAWYLNKHEVDKVPFVAAAAISAVDYTPLYYHQEKKIVPTASLIKLVTAGTIINYPLDWWQKIGFSWADNEGDLRQYLDPGDTFSQLKLNPLDKISLEQVFASMLIGSANNAANRMATVASPSREDFIVKMRQVASQWGMSSTVISEPTGLSLDNLTTAQDVALGTCHALENFMIQYYSSKPAITFTTVNGEKKVINHTVHKLRSDPGRFFGAKTGYLRETGYHIAAGFITPKGKRICVSVLSTKDRATSEAVLYDMGEWVDEMYSW